jgi:PAS domain S-box-containing protein
MSLPYAYTPQIWPSVITTLMLIALAVYSWHRRSVPGALPFCIALIFGTLWMIGISMEVAAVDASTQIFWIKFQTVWLLPSVTGITCFLLEFAWPGRWLTRRNLVLLFIPSLLALGMIFTNDLHHLVWQGFADVREVIPLIGSGYWFILAYAYALTLVNLVVLVWLFIRSPQHRWPVVFILTGQVGLRVVYTLEAAQVIRTDLPIEAVTFWFQILMYMIALYGFRILDPIPLANQTVISQMREGMLVVDREGRVAGMNPAAGKILGASDRQVRGRPVRELLPSCTNLQAGSLGEIEISLGEGSEIRDYLLASSLLKDWRGQEAGHLLLLRDVTEQKQAQAQLVEQQQALAMLHEREHLARELHDNLGQVFAFVNTQGQTILRLLSRGDIATADAYTRRLVEVAREADVDIRESILGLRVALSGQEFFPLLNQYLARYEKNYAIHTELERPESMQDGLFDPLIEVQLLRILQEALTNVRKHAGANSVRIAFAFENHCIAVTVQDDGLGFDHSTQSGELGEHVGLRVMRERAEEVGGSLWIGSSPGAGTRVVVRLPVKSNSEKAADNA